MSKQTEIWSIYGQIDAVVARAMVEEGKFNQIPYTTIPPSQLYNERGDKVLLAVVAPHVHHAEYYQRVALLRA